MPAKDTAYGIGWGHLHDSHWGHRWSAGIWCPCSARELAMVYVCTARFTSYSTDPTGFWVFLPPGGVTIASMLLLYIPEQTHKLPLREILPQIHKKLDFIDFALFAPSCLMFLIALSFGGTTHPWDSATVIGLLVGSVVTLALFIGWLIHMQEDALMPSQ
jgi:FtsH-binding integral membrane protein